MTNETEYAKLRELARHCVTDLDPRRRRCSGSYGPTPGRFAFPLSLSHARARVQSHAGHNRLTWEPARARPAGMPAGVYFLVLEAGDQQRVQRVVVTR